MAAAYLICSSHFLKEGTRMGFSRKLNRSRLGRTANRIFSTTMAATFALTPLAQTASAAENASNIVRTDGTRIDFNNNAADIYAEKVKGDIGINRFQHFDLADGNIANLYFREANSSAWASKLLNLVQNQINVAGAVNAIKDGKIGGDLFFLSPKGMVVSGSGVINAGSLTVAVPTQDFFDRLSYAAGKDANGNDTKDTINLFTGDADTILGTEAIAKQLTGEVAYPVNPSGTIAVAGKINVANLARLTADVVRTEAGSRIRNAVDFSDIANVPQSIADQATINNVAKRLTAKIADDDGIYILGQNDVVIDGEIQANLGTADIQAVNKQTVDLGELKGNEAKLLDSQKLKANASIVIGENADIFGEDGVNISATAETKFTGKTTNAPAGKSSDTAKSAGEKVKDGIAESKGSGSLADSVTSMLDKINVMLDENEATATVTVKNGAKIGSSGDVSINADAASESSMTLTIQPTDVGKSGDSLLNKILVGGANYNKNKTAATVVIDSELGKNDSIGGKLDIAANAASSSEIETTIKQAKSKDGTSNTGYLTAAINVVNQDTKATVNINRDISAKDDVSVKATSNSTLEVTSGTTVDNNAAASTAINIVSTNTNAEINAVGNITSEDGSVNLAAENKYDKIAISTDNDYTKDKTDKPAKPDKAAGGSSAGNAGAAPAAGEDVVESSGTAGAAEGLQDLLGKNEAAAPAADAGLKGANKNADDKQGATSGDTEAVKEAKGTTETDKKPEQSKTDDAKKTDDKTGWNQYFDIGASVAVANFDNRSTVNIGGNIKAAKDIAATAETNPADISILTSNNLTNTQKNAKLGVAAAVAIENMHNDASVIVQGGRKLEAADGSISLSANVKHNKTLAEAIAAAIEAAGKDISEDLEAVKDAKTLDDVKEAAKLKNLSESLDATMRTESTTDSEDDNELSAIANGTVGIENITNNANVYLGDAADGSNTVLNAGKDVNLSAKVEGMDLNKAGAFSTETTSGGSVGIGGTVGVQNTYNNSKVEATGKTQINAGGDISANAANNILNITSAIGGSQSSTLGLTGMVAYMGGESNAKVNMLLAASNDPALQGKIINIGTKNTTVLGNLAGQLSGGETAAIGASVGVISYDIYSNAKLGGNNGEISISADDISLKAENASYAANLAVAGVSSKEESASGGKDDEAKKDDVAGTSIKVRADKSSSGGTASDSTKDTMIELQDLTADSDGKHKSDGSEPQGESRLTEASIAKDTNENATEQSKAKTEEQKKNASKVNIAAAGSVAWNDINTSAKAELANAKISPQSQNAKTKMDVAAEDSAYIGAFSGAMALTKAGGKATSGDGKAGESQGFSATLAGAVAGNDVVKKTAATIENVQISNGGTIQNTAINKGAQIAAGVALGSTAKAGYGATGAGSVSLNYVDSTVHAELNKLGMTNGNLQNVASDSDIQIAGGISIDYAKNSAGIGAAVSVNKAANDIAATINSSKLKEVAKLHNEAASQLMQIGTAVSVGIAAGDKNAALLNGAVAANTLTNKLTSAVRGSNVKSDYHETWGGPDNIGGNSTKTEIAILAHDGAVKGNSIQVENSYVADTAKAGFDVGMDGGKAVAGKDMRSYLGKDTSVAVNTTTDTQGNKNNSLAYTNSDYELADGGGNTIVAGAIGVAAGKTNAAIAGSAVYNKVENDFTAGMYDSSVTAYETDIEALNHTNMIGVAAGAAIAAKKTGAAAAGSVAIQDISNNIDADINNSDIKRYKEHRDEENKWIWHRNSDLNIKAHDDSSLVTVAGQGTGAATAATGMAWAQNNLANHANINIEGLQMEKYADGYVKASAANNAKVWAVGASAGLTVGGAQSIGGTLEGAFAANIGRMDTNINVLKKVISGNERKSFLSGTTVELTASQKGKLSAIAGDASATGKTAAVGDAVAINKLGTKDAAQQNKINLNDCQIMLGEQIERANAFIKAEDADEILTVAAGGAVAAGTGIANVSMQGSVADTGIYRDTAATADTVALVGIESRYYPSLSIEADRKSKVISTADALSVSAGAGNAEISAAAGVSTVNMGGTVKASLSQLLFDENRQMTKLSVKANTLNDIMNIGMGASVAAGTTLGVGAVGNVAINNIAVNTEALANNINTRGTVSLDSVAVQANSQDRIRNYAGSLNVAATGGAAAGVGATVVVNNITGNTQSTLRDVTIAVGEAEAGDAVDYTAGSGDAQGTMTAQKNTKKGVLVSADSQHEIENVAVTAGVAVSAEVSADAVASVAVNKIAGKTSAVLGRHSIYSKSNTSGDINVLANDSSRLSSTVVGAAVSASGEAAAAGAAAVDDSSFSRQVQAGMGDDWGNSGTIYIDGDINVRATNAQSAKVDTYGAAAGAAGTAGVALTGSVSNENFASSAEASMTSVVISRAKNISVTADTAKKLDIGNGAYGIAAGTGAVSGAVGVINAKDTSSTKAGMKRVTVKNAAATAGDDDKKFKVLATNNSVLKTLGTTGSAAIGIGGAIGTTIGVNNIRNSVETSLNNVSLNSTWNDFQAGAANKIILSATNDAINFGTAAIGVGVAVNTIDSSTKTNIANSNINAKKIAVTADEERNFDIEMLNANVGGVSIATNVNINTIGKAVEDEYDYENDKNEKYSTNEIKSKGNDGLKIIDDALADIDKQYGDKTGIGASDKHNVDLGGGNDQAGVGVGISGSKLTVFPSEPERIYASADSVKIASTAVNKGDIVVNQGNVGLGTVNVSVGITDVKDSNRISLSDSIINAGKIDIAATNSGTINQTVHQGAVGGGAVNVAVAKLLRTGSNLIDIQNSKLLAQSLVNQGDSHQSVLSISAQDRNALSSNIVGTSAGGVAAGVLVSNVADQSQDTISIGNGSVLKNADYVHSKEKLAYYDTDENGNNISGTYAKDIYKPEYGDVNISARNANTISSDVAVVAAGAVSGNAAVSTVEIGSESDAAQGMTSVNLAGTNTLQGKNINLISENAVQANSNAHGGTAGLIAAGGVVSRINAYGGSRTSLGSTKFMADAVNAKAMNNQKLKSEVHGVSVGGVNVVVNIAEARLNGKTSVEAGDISLSKNIWAATQKFKDGLKDDVAAHEEQAAGGTLNILAEDASSTEAEAKGAVVGLAAASGTNKAITSNSSTVNVSLAANGLAADNLNAAAHAKTSSTAYADGAGGGIIGISPQAAYAENTNNSTATVDLKGSYQLAGDANIAAVNSNKTELLADAMSATLLGGSGVEAKNSSNQTAEVNIKEGTVLMTGGKADIAARNEYAFGAAKDAKYVLKGNGYGGITNEVGSLNNTIIGTAKVNMLSGSSVASAKDMRISAATRNNVKSDAYVYSLGALAGSYLNNAMDISATDVVNQGAGSSIKANGKEAELTLAAADSQDISASTMAETSTGTAAVTTAKTSSSIKRTNTINANGDVYSKKHVNLYAGKFASDELSNLKLAVSAEAYNKTMIPLSTAPTLSNKLEQANTVNIGGRVRSVQDANIYADAGKESVSQFAGAYTVYGGDGEHKFVSTTNGKTNVEGGTQLSDVAANKKDNNVHVSGSVTAGIANVQKVTIGEANQGLVVLTKDEYVAAAEYHKQQGTAMPDNYVVAISDADYSKLSDADKKACRYKRLSELVTIKGNGNEDISADADISSASFSIGSYQYANSLKDRMEELTALMIEYPEGSAHAGYLAEYTRLGAELEASGMATKNANGSYTIKNDTGVAYIDIPELIAAGGNINLQTANVYGSGSLTAKGSPNIDIQNNTSLSINVGNLQVANPGGAIYYNGAAMKDAAAINAQNQDKTKILTTASTALGQAGSISVANKFTGKNSFNYRNEETGADMEAPIISDINIKGSIFADGGDVNISSAQGNIFISGDGASVVGKDVTMKADKGSIAQSFTDDIVNIGGDVQDQYNQVGFKDSAGSSVIAGTGSGSAKGAGRIAGGNVYISAADVNVNGLIQSGFDNYHVEIKLDTKLDKDFKPSASGTMTVSGRMEQIKQDNMGRNLSDSDVLGNPEYRLIAGGQSYNDSKGCYEYIIPVYYNPSTGALLTPDVESGGGQIFISGRISSTGNGNVLCLDGASDISINNDLSNKLVTGKLLSNDVAGKITLADTATNTLSVITRNNDGTMQYSTVALNGNSSYKNDALAMENGNLYFKPDESLRYNWTTGQQVGTTETYEKQWQDTWWGLSDNSASAKDYLVDQTSKLTPTSTGASSTVAKRNGAYIGEVAGNQAGEINKNDYSIWQNNETTSSSMKVDEEKHWTSGFLGCHKNHYYRWTMSDGSEQTNFYSVNAHQKIKIGFIGKADGQSKVDIASKGSIDLTGSVGNRNYAAGSGDSLLGTVNITSANGSINQLGGSIYGANIALKAAGDMQNIDISAAKDVNLSVGSLAGSGMSRNVAITVNGYQGAEGNVHLAMDDAANAGRDSFALTAAGAKGDIETVGSSVIDARRIDLTSQNGSINASVKGGQQALGSDTLSASVNAKANGNITLTQTDGDMRIGRIYSDNGDVTLNVANGSVADALPYGTIQRDDENALLAKWTNMGLFGDADNALLKEKQAIHAKVNAAATQDDERIGDYKQWNKDALLYTIQDSIINPTSDTLPTTASKDPNIKGNNITLNVANNAGIETGKVTRISAEAMDWSTADGLASLKKLSQTDASNVSWDKDAKEFIITEKLPIGVQTNTAAGKLTVGRYTGSTLGKADGNVFIEGRTQVDPAIVDKGNRDLSIGAIMANGNVSISSLGSILNGADAGKAAITGQNLYLSAANAGAIGTRDKLLTIDLLKDAAGTNGTLQAIGSAGIFVDNVGDNALAIKSVSSGGDLVLNAKGDIVMADKTGSTGAADSVLQTENGGTIELVSREGSVGTAEEKTVDGKTETVYEAVRVRNAAEAEGAPKVVVKAAKTIAIEGMSNDPTGTLPSGVLNVQAGSSAAGQDAENIYLNSHGTLQLANDLTASKNIKLMSDSAEGMVLDKNLTANAVALEAKGDILQRADSAIKAAANTNVVGNGKIELLGTNNQFSNLTVDSLSTDRTRTGTIRIVNGEGDLDVTMLNSSRATLLDVLNDNLIAGNIDIQNNSTGILTLAKDHDLHSEGAIHATSQGGIVTDNEVWSNEDVSLAAKDDIHIKKDLLAWNFADGTNQDIVLNAAKQITTDSAATILGNNIRFNAKTGGIDNSALVLADGEFRMVAEDGDIINRASLLNANASNGTPTMSNDIYFEAKNGAVISNEEIIAENDITIKSHKLTASISNNIYAGRNIFLQVSDGALLNTARLESKAGNITLQADNGNVLNGSNGNIFAFGGNVALQAGGKGSVYNQGDILALDMNAANQAEAGNIVLRSDNGDVLNDSDFNTVGGSQTTVDSESAQYLGGLKSYDVAAKNITMSAANGKLENTKNHLVARGDVTLTAKEGLNSLGQDIYAGGDIKLTATDGTMINNAKLVSVNGNVELTAENGSVINMLDGDIFAMGGDVKLVAGAQQEADHSLYKVSDNGKIEKITGFDKPADMPDDAVVITKKFYYVEAKDQDGNPLQDEHGNTYQLKKYIDADDRVSDHRGELYTEVRYIAQNGEEKSLNIFDDPSDSTQKTNILKNDNAEFFRQGDVINRGDAVAMGTTRTVVDEATGESHIESVKAGTVMLESRHGNASNYDNFEAVDGKKELEIDGRSVFNKNTGELYANKKYMLANGNISLRAPEGRFYNDFAIKTDGDLTMEGNYDIVIGNGLNLAEVKGNLNLISSTGSVTNGEDSKIIVNGNVNVSGATGVVNKGSIIAKGGGDVNMSSSGGDIVVGDITGGRVVISSDKVDGVIDVSKGTITSDSYLGIHGDNVKGTIQAAKGDSYQGTMGFGITGAKGGAMKGNMSLVNDGDTTFDILHITDGQAKIGGNGTLKAENVKTKGNLDLYVKGSKTTILGRKAGKQDGQYIYANNGGWMNFFIDNRTHQTSNALLLHIADFHYADSQRFALDDLAGQLLDFNPLMSHRQLLADNIGLFNRYNLYDSTHAQNELAGFWTDNVLDINSTDGGLELVGIEA